MKKALNIKNICALLAIAAILHGAFASVADGKFYWHIFLIAGCFYSLAVADKKNNENEHRERNTAS